MKIKFLGAAGTVTGSKYLITTKKRQYLVDCGLFQGLKDLRQRNWQQDGFNPKDISAVFITHAHIDHTGYIPRLVSKGFQGSIYSSEATFELAKILLPDSGHLQEEEARFINLKGFGKHKPALPLYTRQEAEDALDFFKTLPFHKKTRINDEVEVTFGRAGHILGASCILFESSGRSIVFTGDVGRYNDLIMRPPEPLFDADYLVVESTYGDREHVDEDVFARIAQIINETAAKDGVIIIPSFAVGRAQHILYVVHELKRAKKIPPLPTYLDSPMAIDATDLYCGYTDEHRLSKNACSLMFREAIITRTPEESKSISQKPGAKIIISASGMASGGRVLHHLAHYISDPNNTVAIVGYQAVGTRGRALQEGTAEIKIFGEYHTVKAKIEMVPSLSAHADSRELIRWLNESAIKHPKVFVTHGEKDAALTFAQKLRDTFHWQVEVPKDGQEFEL